MGKSSIDIYIDVFFSNCHYRRVALSMCMIVYAWRDFQERSAWTINPAPKDSFSDAEKRLTAWFPFNCFVTNAGWTNARLGQSTKQEQFPDSCNCDADVYWI